MKVILSISKKEADLIFEGKQKVLIKPHLNLMLEWGDTILFYQTKTNQTIVGQAEVTFCDLIPIPSLPRGMAPSFTLRDQMELEQRGIYFVYLIKFINPKKYLTPETHCIHNLKNQVQFPKK